MAPFATPLEHLDAVLGLIRVVVERQIIAQWETGALPRTDADLRSAPDQLFGRGPTTTIEGTQRINALDAELARLEAELAERTTPDLPLERLRSAFDLGPREERVVHLAIAAELSPPVRQQLRYLASDPRRHTLDRAALEVLVYGRAGRTWLHQELGPRGVLLERQLLETVPGAESLMFQGLRATARVVELATGVLRIAPELEDLVEHVAEPVPFDELVVAAPIREQLTSLLQQPAGLAASPAILLTGASGSGRKTLLGAAAQATGKGVLRIRCSELPRDAHGFAAAIRGALREAILLDAVPLFVEVDRLTEDDPSRSRERILDTLLGSWRRPLAATAGHGQAQPLKLSRGTISIEAPALTEADREVLWRKTLRGGSSVDFAQIAARFPVTPGMLVHASHAAGAVAAARDGRITESDLQLGLRSAMDEAVSALGQRLTRAQKWEDLIAPTEVMDALKEFVARIKYRRRVFDEWGFADKYTKGLGLSALFTGPPGTGKTMAATLVAGQLGLDVYQIDVSRIVSKFIGETEKNLAQVFDAAEAGHAIILFDEADALFASRGEVKSSVDRYANLEVNYLLQRLERFSGITVLTTNLASSIDAAFKRRISFTVEFPMPEEKERERIWRTHLPARAHVAGETDFSWLAQRHVMSGGHIRNAVLRAAFLAAAEGDAIRFEHLRRAAENRGARDGACRMSAARLLTLLGSTYEVDVAGLLERLATLGGDRATVTVSHGFDRFGVVLPVTLDRLAVVCHPDQTSRITALADGHTSTVELALEAAKATPKRLAISGRVVGTRSLDADLAHLATFGVEPQVLDGARAAVTELGAEMLVSVTDAIAGDGARGWELRVAQTNHTDALRDATRARIERVAAACKVTPAQRRVAGGLHDSLAREQLTHVWVRGTRRALAPALGLVWARVEWQPIQRMLAGFHPAADPVARVAQLARAADVEVATVELVLGPSDPPALRILVSVEGT